MILSAAAACGDDPVQYSDTVGINLKAKSSDTVNSVVSDEKSITTESGNPYGAFVSDATAMLGRDPASIDVEHLELLLGGSSTGVTSLGEIFAGDLEVLFVMNDTNNSVVVGGMAIEATTAGGPVEVGVDFDRDALSDADYDKLLQGSFKVVARGPAAADFQTKGADADLQLTFTFGAYE